MRSRDIPVEQFQRAGSLLRRTIGKSPADPEPMSVRLIGQCTTAWLAEVLTAVAWRDGVRVRITEAEYDNVMQDLLQLRADSSDEPEAVVLIPWNQRLLGDSPAISRTSAERVADELQHWQTAWSHVEVLHAKLVQVGFDWVTTGGFGYHAGSRADGAIDMIRQANVQMRAALPTHAYFVDLEAASGEIGRNRFYDLRHYHWTKQPFSEEGLAWIAEHVWCGIRALTTGPKKVLVVDLDGTLWGGVVGELGPHRIELGESPNGEAFRSFQCYLKNLSRLGTLLAVCSKNNHEDAIEPFHSTANMVLKPEEIAAFEASWDPKPVAICRIAERLNLGLDSFVFFDDNPAEREQVRAMLPEVQVVDVPTDPADYVRALDSALCFERLPPTAEDNVRTEQYQQERQRQTHRLAASTVEEYQQSLEMVATIGPVDESNIHRIAQLVGKTNQFNLTTRRHTPSKILDLVSRPGAISLCLQLQDRFGDYGIISVLIAVPSADDGDGSLEIDTWLMSCRAIGRTVEDCLFNVLVTTAKRQGTRRLIGWYCPTPKNALVGDLYDRLGFRHADRSDDTASAYTLDLDYAVPSSSYVAIRS